MLTIKTHNTYIIHNPLFKYGSVISENIFVDLFTGCILHNVPLFKFLHSNNANISELPQGHLTAQGDLLNQTGLMPDYNKLCKGKMKENLSDFLTSVEGLFRS